VRQDLKVFLELQQLKEKLDLQVPLVQLVQLDRLVQQEQQAQ
jgi:hypothetical protein